MIEFKNATKKFPDGTLAVNDVSFVVTDGEFTFLVGPSGAGKTTVFRLLIRDFPPTSGEVVIEGSSLGKLKGSGIVQMRRKIGVVFQDLKLIAEKNVWENVSLSLEVLGKKRKDIDQEVAEKLRLVGMWDHRFHFPAQLSGGEAQRVALARAVAGAPKFLLADEPTGNVDEANTWAIMKILDKINKTGTTVIVATHDRDIVSASQRRVIYLEDGHLISDHKEKGR